MSPALPPDPRGIRCPKLQRLYTSKGPAPSLSCTQLTNIRAPWPFPVSAATASSRTPRSIRRQFHTSNAPNRTISAPTTAGKTRLACHPVEQAILAVRKTLSESTRPPSVPWLPRRRQQGGLRQLRAGQPSILDLEAHPHRPASPTNPVKHRQLPLESDVHMVSSSFSRVSSEALL